MRKEINEIITDRVHEIFPSETDPIEAEKRMVWVNGLKSNEAKEYWIEKLKSEIEESEKQNIDFKELVLSEYKKGKLVISTFEGVKTAPLKEIVKQPIDGLLYDLNRNESVILTFINDAKWVNDYATIQVLRYFDSEIHRLKQENEELKLHKEQSTEVFEKWDKVHDFVSNHPTSKLGDSITENCLKLLTDLSNKDNKLKEAVRTLQYIKNGNSTMSIQWAKGAATEFLSKQ